MTNKPRIERSAEKLAQFFHDTYEHHAKAEGWNTQQGCKVEFDNLPEANRRTMIKTCMDVLDALEASTPPVTDSAEQAALKIKESLGGDPYGNDTEFDLTVVAAIIQAYADAQVAKTRAQAVDGARDFARWAIKEGPWNGCSLDGGEIQDKAVALGLLEKRIANELNGDEWQHIEGVEEIGDEYYVFSPALNSPNNK